MKTMAAQGGRGKSTFRGRRSLSICRESSFCRYYILTQKQQGVTTANAAPRFPIRRYRAERRRGAGVKPKIVECQMFERGGERKVADFVRKWLGVDSNTWIDVIKCLSLGRIWTVAGEKRLVLEIVSSSEIASSEMRGVDAITINGKDIIIIKVTESVYKLALAGAARARMTLAHELGHAVLCHPGDALARVTGVSRSTPISSVA